MAAVVVAGGGMTGLAAALALAEQGFRVRVLERAAPPPDGPAVKAVERWRRPTVPQSAHSHVLTSLGVRELRRWLPRVLEAVIGEGAELLDMMVVAPRDGRPSEPADAELVALAVRRSVLELVLYQAAAATPNIEISHGVRVGGLLLDAAGERVTGVVTDAGQHVTATAVVDATGRRAASREWLRAAGIPVAEDLIGRTALRAFTRFYRLRDPATRPGPLNRGNAAGGIWDHYAAVIHLADNGVFAVSVGVLTNDPPATSLRAARAFTAAARLSPYVEAWLHRDVAEPITDVRVITCPPNVLRGTVTTNQRPVAGLLPAGDAACVTDPLYGRGMSLALCHGFRVAELLAGGVHSGQELAERAVAVAENLLRPWYEQAAADSLTRSALWRARAAGTTRAGGVTLAGRPDTASILAAASTDSVVWRAVHRVLMGLDTPARAFDDPDFRVRVRAAPPPRATQQVAPTRQELLAAIAPEAGA